MIYISEKISVIAYLLSFMFLLTGMFVMLPPKSLKYLLGAAIASMIVALIAGAYANAIYGWDF